MPEPVFPSGRISFLVALLLAVACGWALIEASDHSDAPRLGTLVRNDANLTDFHAFVSGSNLVLALSANAAIPPSATSYMFPSNVTFEFHIDVDCPVAAEDPNGDGGTLLDPRGIDEEIIFRIRFRDDGSARIQRFVRGARMDDPQIVSFFAGLRDDPFIRGPRIGRNVGSIVLEVPLSSVVREQSTLVIWATSKVEEFDGPFQEIAGRSLRSMFAEQNALNSMQPRQSLVRAGLRPDVMMFDTSKPAAYPNGRALTDDVVDLVCALSHDCRVVTNDSPFPSANDVPFLSTFPYLAPPHPAP